MTVKVYVEGRLLTLDLTSPERCATVLEADRYGLPDEGK